MFEGNWIAERHAEVTTYMKECVRFYLLKLNEISIKDISCEEYYTYRTWIFIRFFIIKIVLCKTSDFFQDIVSNSSTFEIFPVLFHEAPPS